MVLSPREDYCAGAIPTPGDVRLLVEVADSSLAYEREVKIPLYASHGVAVVWLLDVANRVLEIYGEPVEGVYTLKRTPPLPPLSTRVSAEGLGGFEVLVDELFL